MNGGAAPTINIFFALFINSTAPTVNSCLDETYMTGQLIGIFETT